MQLKMYDISRRFIIICGLLFVATACSEAGNETANTADDAQIENTIVEEADSLIMLEDNKLDTILGDKILDFELDLIRANNFESFKDITEQDLEKSSKIYEVTSINEEFYLLKQKRKYTEARLFNAILKTANDTVIDYYILNDYHIKDINIDGESMLILADDWGNENYYWRRNLEAKIVKLDLNFNSLWEYDARYHGPLEAERISSAENFDTYTINVVTGCHICYVVVELRLSKTGEFISVEQVYLYNAEYMPQDELNEIFNKE